MKSIKIIILLICCHLIGDYVFQSDFIAKTKRENITVRYFCGYQHSIVSENGGLIMFEWLKRYFIGNQIRVMDVICGC